MRFDELVWWRDADPHGHGAEPNPLPCTYAVRDGELYVIIPNTPFPGAEPDGERFWVYKTGYFSVPHAIDMTDLCLWLAAATPSVEGTTYTNTSDYETIGVQMRDGKPHRLWVRPKRHRPLTVKGVYPRE